MLSGTVIGLIFKIVLCKPVHTSKGLYNFSPNSYQAGDLREHKSNICDSLGLQWYFCLLFNSSHLQYFKKYIGKYRSG